MIHILTEIKFSMEKKLHLTFIVICLGIISTSLSFFSINLYSSLYENTEQYHQLYEGVSYYKTADNFVGEAEKKFEKDTNKFLKLKEYNEIMNNHEDFDYLEQYKQQIYIKDYKGNVSNLYRYEEGDYQNSKDRLISSPEGKEEAYSSVKSVWIGSNIIEYFKLILSEGEAFNEEDFVWHERQAIRIIMGHEYKNDYEVGDRIQLHIIMDHKEAIIAGFFEEGSNIAYQGQLLNLDRYVAIPLFNINEIPQTKNQEFVFWMLYLMKNSGTVATTLSANQVQDIIFEICNDIDIKPAYYVSGATNQQSSTFGMNMSTILEITFAVSIGVLIFTSIILTIYLYIKIQKNSRYYAILLMNGFSTKDLIWMVVGEILFIIGVSTVGGSIIAMILCQLLLGRVVSIGYVLIPALFSGVLPFIIAVKKLLRMDLCVYLREE